MTNIIHDLERKVLALINEHGIDAAHDKYLRNSLDLKSRQITRIIFAHLKQDTITGEWSLKKFNKRR